MRKLKTGTFQKIDIPSLWQLSLKILSEIKKNYDGTFKLFS